MGESKDELEPAGASRNPLGYTETHISISLPPNLQLLCTDAGAVGTFVRGKHTLGPRVTETEGDLAGSGRADGMSI